jgi:nicotinamidase-related amidase
VLFTVPPPAIMDGMKKETYITPETLDAKTDEWLEAIAPWNFRDLRLDAGRAALIVVDMQRFFLEEGFPLASENSRIVVPRVRTLIDAFRSAGRPVVFLVNQSKGIRIDRGRLLSEWWPETPLEGTPEVEVHPDLAPLSSEKVIPKRRYSGFHATDLDLTLRSMEVADVVICGVITNVCPESTARDAFMHGYRVFFVADATATLTEGMHVASLRTLAGWFAKVVRSKEIVEALRI